MIKIKLLLTAALFLTFNSLIFAQGPRSAASKLVLRFDNAPQDISWELRGPSGDVVQTGGPYDSQFANQVVNFEFTTLFGTSPLTFTIKDASGNGLQGNGAWAINTERLARIEARDVEDVVGNRIANGNSNFGSETTITFDPTSRTSNLGALGALGFRDIDLIQTRGGSFFRIFGSRFRPVNITISTPDEDGAPSAIESLVDLRVITSRLSGRATIVITSQIADSGTIEVRDGNGTLVTTRTVSLRQGRLGRRILLRNLTSGLNIVRLQTNNTTGAISKSFIVR
ncbi:T9SS type A sorting domain-containing protein [uncultured Algibacter sp.]|uniref:T9SS type A sorting domain-containing protein n=1 Tax=uncultured Algibacter sp. TaxID=298659 RepID=UPI003217FB7D